MTTPRTAAMLLALAVAGLLAVPSGVSAQTDSSGASPAPAPGPTPVKRVYKKRPFGGVKMTFPKVNTTLPQVKPSVPNVLAGQQDLPINRTNTRLPPNRPPSHDRHPGHGGGDRPPIFVQPDHDGHGGHGGHRPPHHFPGHGTHIDGHYNSDHFRLGFHLGSSYPYSLRHNYGYWGGYGYGYYNYGSPFYWTDGGPWYRWPEDYPRPLYTSYGYVDPFAAYGSTINLSSSPTPPPPPRELTDLELANLALVEGDWPVAVQRYRRLLDVSPQDASLMRALGMALIETKQTSEAVAMIALAYETDPSLAKRPFTSDSMDGGTAGMRSRVVALVNHANKVDTASAWLAAAVLVQGEGRTAVARKMLDRAAAKGLSKKVVDALTAELSL